MAECTPPSIPEDGSGTEHRDKRHRADASASAPASADDVTFSPLLCYSFPPCPGGDGVPPNQWLTATKDLVTALQEFALPAVENGWEDPPRDLWIDGLIGFDHDEVAGRTWRARCGLVHFDAAMRDGGIRINATSVPFREFIDYDKVLREDEQPQHKDTFVMVDLHDQEGVVRAPPIAIVCNGRVVYQVVAENEAGDLLFPSASHRGLDFYWPCSGEASEWRVWERLWCHREWLRSIDVPSDERSVERWIQTHVIDVDQWIDILGAQDVISVACNPRPASDLVLLPNLPHMMNRVRSVAPRKMLELSPECSIPWDEYLNFVDVVKTAVEFFHRLLQEHQGLRDAYLCTCTALARDAIESEDDAR